MVRDDRWDRALQLLGGLHYLALRDGIDPWGDPAAAVTEHADWLRGFVAEHGIQTNEVQRSWMLLPCFLEIVRRTGTEILDLIEIGPSAGLNLVWDRYRYRYENGGWGKADAALELSGEERRPVPGSLWGFVPWVRRRRGIDLSPLDLTRDEDTLLLKAFVWADQQHRLERLNRAVETLRTNPPVLERGDAAERLPELLAERQPGALTIVVQTAVTGYLGERAERIVGALEDAARQFPLAFVWTARPAPDVHDYWGLWVRIWPEGEPFLIEHAGFHGQWLEWLGEDE